MPLTPEEATLLALGIYEETGFLTFTSTTEGDLHAAAYCLSRGANLSLVADFIRRFYLAGVKDPKRLTFKGLQALGRA